MVLTNLPETSYQCRRDISFHHAIWVNSFRLFVSELDVSQFFSNSIQPKFPTQNVWIQPNPLNLHQYSTQLYYICVGVSVRRKYLTVSPRIKNELYSTPVWVVHWSAIIDQVTFISPPEVATSANDFVGVTPACHNAKADAFAKPWTEWLLKLSVMRYFHDSNFWSSAIIALLILSHSRPTEIPRRSVTWVKLSPTQ